MNKKFSTLLASVLLAGGFSFNAQAAGMPAEAKAGDYVKIGTTGSAVLTISDGSLSQVDLSSIVSGNAFVGAKGFKDLFNTLWRVEVIKPAETSAALSYRFVNKQTGEYLAIKLQTNNKGTSKGGAAKIDATGNKEWSVDASGHLYAYVPSTTAGKDSTFFLANDLSLSAKQGLPGTLSGIAFNITLPTDFVTLTAKAFNDVMALPGNGGKLYFNNSKDVSSNETNVLTDAKKWEAVEYSSANKTFALWNGETVKGTTNDMTKTKDGKGYINIDKKKYLQVDTIYHDDANKYLALTADTIPYDSYKAGKVGDVEYIAGTFTPLATTKGAVKRATASAEFSGAYYYANDSIVLKAKVVPTRATKAVVTPGTSTFTAVADYDVKLAAALAVAAEKTALKSAITALDAAYTAFQNEENSTVAALTFAAYTSGGKTGAELIQAVTDANTASNAAVTTYTTAFNNYEIAAATAGEASNKSDDITSTKNAALAATGVTGVADQTAAVNALAAAYDVFKTQTNTTANVIAFTDFQFATGGTAVGTDVTGQDLLDAFTATSNTEVDAFKAKFGNLQLAAATPAAATPISSYSDKKTAAEAAAAANPTLRMAINAVNAAYESFAGINYNENTVLTFANATFDDANLYDPAKTTKGSDLISVVTSASTVSAVTTYTSAVATAQWSAKAGDTPSTETLDIFYDGENALTTAAATDGQVILRKLGKGMVLTVVNDGALDPSTMKEDGTINGYTLPLIQPYATMAGDAVIATNNLYFWQIKNEIDPKVTDLFKVYTYANNQGALTKEVASADTSAYNPATQWGVIKGATDGYYQIVNRETDAVKYVGPVFVVKDEDGDVIADTYVAGSDTLKLIAVDRSGLSFVTESKVVYDYNGYFFAGADNDKVKRTFKISSASPYLNALYMQSKKDSVVVLGEDAVVWALETVDKSANVYGAEVTGIENLKRVKYNVSMTDADGNKYYIYNNTTDDVFSITKSDSKEAKDNKAEFYFKAVAKGQYLIVDTKNPSTWAKMTVNPQPKQPIVESSNLISEKNDYFTIEQTNLNVYRELGVTKADDGLMLAGVDSAKIFMENEPTRFLYENSINIVANNGNKVAKDSLNFLGIYNSAATVNAAALFIDTAYVARKDNYMPQYMIGLRQSYQEAGTIIDCPDKNPNCTDPSHRKATAAYRTADYLVSLSDSVPAGVKNHPSLYDGAVRLAFVPATHIGDSVIISNSKFTGTKQAKNDTLKVADNTPNKATFALRIKDQETKSFYMETVGGAFVRILNGVPVLTDKIADAGIFNIAKTTETPTANEDVTVSEVSVSTREGFVVVKGAAGKKVVITNVLGQTIANTVVTSSEAEIAAPAGVVVVAVEGEAAVKAIVK